MGIDRDIREAGVLHGVEKPRGIALLGDVAAWKLANKSLLVSIVVLGLVLYATLLLHFAQRNLDLLPFLDPVVLEQQIGLSYVTIAIWILLGAVSLFFRRGPGDSEFFAHAPIQLYVVSNVVFGYLFGFFTDPYAFVTLVGGMMVALPLFGAKATRLGLISWLSIFSALTLLEQFGQIPYAPLLKSSPVIDRSISLPWTLGMGSITVTGGVLATVFGFYLVGQLRKRDKLLQKNQQELLKTVEDLGEATTGLEEARRQLEIRVEERTLELKGANRNLQSEIAAREKSAVELSNLRAAMEAAIEGVARVDADGKIQTANPAFLAMHGAEEAEMIGSPANAWVHADNRPEVMKAVLDLNPAEKAELSVTGLRADTSAFGEVIAMVRIPDGDPGAHYRFARDVTRQNELSEQLNQAMKMEAVGQLAGGIAHDFNNLLMAILTAGKHFQVFFRESPASEQESEMADLITMAGTRAAALTTQLLDFSHVQPPSIVSIDINQSIRNALELIAPALGESIDVVTKFSSQPLFSLGDPARFDSGLLNVALNARDAMPERGRLTVQTRSVTMDLDDPDLEIFQPREGDIHPDGRGYARIDMMDDGSGMDSETLARALDPFFTTKPVGQGTGLGLSVFSTYIREVGGALRMFSVPGQGTTCSIYLPLSERDARSDEILSSAPNVKGNEMILLAEDEDMVARATTMLLTKRGYKVLRCANGSEAVDLYRERKKEIDLVLLDLRMPVMTGAEAFMELKRLDPEVPVILMSGNLSLPEFSDLKKQGLRAILRKPCSGAELATAIREALGDPEPIS